MSTPAIRPMSRAVKRGSVTPAATVLIAGGGFAAVEAMLALPALAAGEAQVTLISPDPVLHYRPAATLETTESARARGYDLHGIALDAGACYRTDRVEAVVPEEHHVRTSSGARLGYDALILAAGARAVAGIQGALLFRDQRDTHMIQRLFGEIDAGVVRSITFVVPSGCSWPLPAYELALLSAGRAERDELDLEVSLVTPERAPLEVFGPRSSRHIADLLSERGVRFRGSTTPTSVRRDGTLDVAFAAQINADQVVAVPALRGRRITGIPASWWGFVPTDAAGRVDGLSDVYAAGDMTSFPVKNGGLAAQQADLIVHGLAARLGVPVRELRQRHVLQAVLHGGGRPILLRTELDWQGQPTAATLQHIDRPRDGWPTKVFGRYLTPYLESVERPAA